MNTQGAPEPPARPADSELRCVRRELASARDEQLARVVALLDAMPARGDADAVVAPFRDRLAVLKPTRPLSFTRLLFTPLNPLIVAPASWRRGAQTVPRHTLSAFSAIVRAAMGPRARAVENAISKQIRPPSKQIDPSPHAHAPIAELGRMLWPEAAQILAAATVPDRWRIETSLSDHDFAPLARLISALLAMALDRQIIAEQISHDGMANPANLSDIVAASLGAPADIAVAATGMLLVGMPRPDLVMEAVEAQSPAAGAAAAAITEGAIVFALKRTQAGAGALADQAPNLDSLRQGAALLQAIESRPTQAGNRRALIQQVRATVEEGCGKIFADTVNTHLHGAMAEFSGVATDGQIASLEQTARDLRELETIGRQLGRATAYRDKLQSTLARVQACPNLTLVDRVRLTELLADTETAMQLLNAKP